MQGNDSLNSRFVSTRRWLSMLIGWNNYIVLVAFTFLSQWRFGYFFSVQCRKLSQSGYGNSSCLWKKMNVIFMWKCNCFNSENIESILNRYSIDSKRDPRFLCWISKRIKMKIESCLNIWLVALRWHVKSKWIYWQPNHNIVNTILCKFYSLVINRFAMQLPASNSPRETKKKR